MHYHLEGLPRTNASFKHGFQNWTGPGGRTVKTKNRDENRFLSLKNQIFC